MSRQRVRGHPGQASKDLEGLCSGDNGQGGFEKLKNIRLSQLILEADTIEAGRSERKEKKAKA